MKTIATKKHNKIILTLAVLICIFNISPAYSKKNKEQEVEIEKPGLEYLTSMYYYASDKPKVAGEKLVKLQTQYPNFSQTEKIVALRVYFHYLAKEYREAQKLADEIIEQSKRNDFYDYIEFMRAFSYYRQISDLGKGNAEVIKALQAFSIIAAKKNQYSEFSAKKAEYLQYLQVYNKIDIAKTYQSNQDYFAAIKILIELEFSGDKTFNPSTAKFIKYYKPIILFRLIECFHDIGLKKEAEIYKIKFLQSLEDNESYYPFSIEGVYYHEGSDEYIKEIEKNKDHKKTLAQAKREFKKINKEINDQLFKETKEKKNTIKKKRVEKKEEKEREAKVESIKKNSEEIML